MSECGAVQGAGWPAVQTVHFMHHYILTPSLSNASYLIVHCKNISDPEIKCVHCIRGDTPDIGSGVLIRPDIVAES